MLPLFFFISNMDILAATLLIVGILIIVIIVLYFSFTLSPILGIFVIGGIMLTLGSMLPSWNDEDDYD